MKILIGNDDGIRTQGMLELVKALSKNHEVRVYAPMDNRSGFSHSLSVRRPIYVQECDIFAEYGVFGVEFSGTPADCIKLGLELYPDYVPDVVVGGVNHGPNMGMDIMYSGTCGVAMEGSIYGACGIAVSLDSHSDIAHHETAARIVAEYLEELVGAHNGTSIWNINVPNLAYEELCGVEFTKIGVQIYSDIYEKFQDEKGVYYMLSGHALDHDQNTANCDVEVVKHGKVSITPVMQDRTDYAELERIAGSAKK